MPDKNRSELEKTLLYGLSGNPEMRRQEKLRFLGFFRERVLQAVSVDQLQSETGRKAMNAALADPRAVELVVASTVRLGVMPLIKRAQELGLDFTITTNTQFKGPVVAVVVAQQAVDVPRLLVE